MILEAQGFYNRPVLCSRSASAWLLLKGCFFIMLVVMAMFLLRIDLPRQAVVWFGCISFGLMSLKEELLLQFLHSKLALAQYRRALSWSPPARKWRGCAPRSRPGRWKASTSQPS